MTTSGQEDGFIEMESQTDPDTEKLFVVEKIVDRGEDDKVGTFYLLNSLIYYYMRGKPNKPKFVFWENSFWVKNLFFRLKNRFSRTK